jgi:methionine synthase II (cobalamin-independent)
MAERLCKEAGTTPDVEVLHARTRRAVDDIVRKQVEAGVDIVSDGEQGRG